MISQEILRPCINLEIESVIKSWRSDIEYYAQKYGVMYFDIEKQIRLHLPLLIEHVEDCRHFPKLFSEILDKRFREYSNTYNNYLEKSGGKYLLNKNTIIKRNQVVYNNQKIFDIQYSNVNNEVGELIEKKLHYLRNPRTDIKMRFGLYIEDYKYPLCYMSYSDNIRDYLVYSLKSALKEKVLYSHEITQLARVYGFGNLPRDTISKMVSYSANKLKALNFKYIVTAINPFIGFNGSSMKASGFVPFAYCKVGYSYDKNNEYQTRRKGSEYLENAKFNGPPNLLLVKGITKESAMKVTSIENPINVPIELFNDINPVPIHLSKLREKLEDSWSAMTAYHGTPKISTDPVSKGQCGVTTAYLAKEFESNGYPVLFCEGDAFFPNGIKPIFNHCWLKIPLMSESIYEYKNIIVDLTSDQNGFNESIICETEENLKDRFINYISRSEISPSTIDSKSLINRLNILKQSLDSLNQPII